MKKCCKCQEKLPASSFGRNATRKDGLQSYCRTCQAIKNKEWNTKNKDKRRAMNNATKQNTKQFINEHKLSLGCSICGYKKCPAALDLHHVTPSEKKFPVSLAIWYGYSLDKVKREIKKCIVVCSNCHRELHHSPV